MLKEEVLQILSIIALEYPNAQITTERILFWEEKLKYYPFNKAWDNLMFYLSHPNAHAPNISHIGQIDEEAERLNLEIAFTKFVNGGGDPDNYVHEPTARLGDGNTPKLRS